MRYPRGRLTRWTAAILVTALGLTTVGASVATPANAASTFVDGFEGNPYSRWQVVEREPNSTVYLGNHRDTFEGENFAFLHAVNNVYAQLQNLSGIVLERPGHARPICGGSLMMALAPLAFKDPRTRSATVYLRLWAGTARNVPPLSEIVHTVTHGFPYESYRFGGFAFQENTPLYIEISATNGVVLIDDVRIGCVDPPT
jgi:hypothetical protein